MITLTEDQRTELLRIVKGKETGSYFAAQIVLQLDSGQNYEAVAKASFCTPEEVKRIEQLFDEGSEPTGAPGNLPAIRERAMDRAHMTPEQAAESVLDSFCRAVRQELELLELDCLDDERPGPTRHPGGRCSVMIGAVAIAGRHTSPA